MALTDEQKERVYLGAIGNEIQHSRRVSLNIYAAIESAACAERDARIAELERQLAEARKDAERWVHACKCNNKNINVSAWDNDAMEFVGYAMKKEAIDAIADAEIAAMQKG